MFHLSLFVRARFGALRSKRLTTEHLLAGRMLNNKVACSCSLFTMLLCFVVVPIAWAQKDAGSIVGLVKDNSGAVVAGAKVTVTDVDRGTAFDTSTNSTGEYAATPLRIGRYTVTV